MHSLTIAVLLLALAALGLKILNRISTHPELISTSLSNQSINDCKHGFTTEEGACCAVIDT